MITVEALVFLMLGIFGGRMASAGFTGDYFNVASEFMLKWQLTPAGFLVDLVAIGGFLGALWLAHRGWNQQEKYRYFLKASGLIAGVLLIFLFLGRLFYGSPYGSHDGVIQSEVAAQMLLQGTNPYAATFQHTTFAFFHPARFGQPVNPVLFHYAYPPAVLLLHTPVAAWSIMTGWPMDGRIMTVAAYIILVVLLLRSSKNLQYRTWIAIGFLANPLLFIYPLIGFNDIFFLLFIVSTALLARQRRWWLAGAMLGLALASKQTAFIALPLWAWWLYVEVHHHRLPSRTAWLSLAWAGGVAAAIYLPFIVWNPAAFYDDVIRYVSGVVPHTYPIGGDSLYEFLVLFRVVPDAWAATRPFIGVALAALIFLPISAWWIRRRPTASQWLTSFVMVTFFISLANRYLYENYVSGLIGLASVSLALAWIEQHDGVAPSSGTQ